MLKAQGPIDGYMKGAGQTDFALSYSVESFTKYYLGTELQDTFNRQYNTVSLFFAHGFENKLGLIASVPYVRSDNNNSAFQDAQIFLKYSPIQNRNEDGSGFNLITAAGITTPVSNYPTSPSSTNPIGERATSLETRLGGQYQFKSGVFIYAKTGLTYRISPQEFATIPTLIRVGFGSSKVYADIWLEGIFALNQNNNTQVLGGSGSTWLKTGGVFYYALTPHIGVTLGGAYTFWGRNIGIAPRGTLGLVYKIF